MCVGREEGAQLDFDQTRKWHSGAKGVDRQMGWDEVGGENLCPMQLG